MAVAISVCDMGDPIQNDHGPSMGAFNAITVPIWGGLHGEALAGEQSPAVSSLALVPRPHSREGHRPCISRDSRQTLKPTDKTG